MTKNNIFCSKIDVEKWSRKNVFEIPQCAQQVIFITEFALLIKTPLFYEVNSFNRKWLAHERIKLIFSRPLFIIIFRPKLSFFVTYSILTGQTKVEFDIYWADVNALMQK